MNVRVLHAYSLYPQIFSNNPKTEIFKWQSRQIKILADLYVFLVWIVKICWFWAAWQYTTLTWGKHRPGGEAPLGGWGRSLQRARRVFPYTGEIRWNWIPFFHYFKKWKYKKYTCWKMFEHMWVFSDVKTAIIINGRRSMLVFLHHVTSVTKVINNNLIIRLKWAYQSHM